MQLSLLTVFLGALWLVAAQDNPQTAQPNSPAAPAPPSGANADCVIQCSTEALPAGQCDAITDFDCVCTSEPYQKAVRDCLAAKCPPEAMQTAMGLQQQGCGSRTPSPSSAPAPEGSGAPPSATGNPEGSSVPPASQPSNPPAPAGGSTAKPTSTGGTKPPPASAAPSATGSRNAAPGQAALLFAPDVMVAIGMVWVGVFLGVLIA